MKIAGLQKNSMIDYPGKISAVVFTQGCNMNCGYCHNRRLINHNLNSSLIEEEEVLAFLEKRRGLLDGVVVSGGEPTLQKDLFCFFEQIRAMGYSAKLDTNGTNPSVLSQLIERGLLDYVAMDVKAPLCKYRQICCSPVNPEYISESIDLLIKGKVEYEFRTTYTPELCDEDLIDITHTIKGAKRFVLQQYKEVDETEGTYTGVVERRNILNNITTEIRKSVEALQFRGEFGML
jgi:pyruvate formate lyase activating enzyme